jgi:hypothetical protein
MVALDPLYVVDLSEALLQPAVSHFPDMYQIRVRQYVINDKTDDKIFDRLPKGQFGLIFAYSYFNFLPMEMIKRYLAESMELLRPGGTIIFTYNDCDREESVGSVENHFMCYTPGGKIQQMAKELKLQESLRKRASELKKLYESTKKAASKATTIVETKQITKIITAFRMTIEIGSSRISSLIFLYAPLLHRHLVRQEFEATRLQLHCGATKSRHLEFH